MRINRIKQLWDENKPVVNGWLSTADPFIAELMAAESYDSLTVDLQHGLGDYRTALASFQATAHSGMTMMARIPWCEGGTIMRLLDAGCQGLICPLVNNRSEAEAFVSYTRYPPAGCRSFGPTRAKLFDPDHYPAADQAIVRLAMIETAEGMANLDEIVATPGLDGVYIGPADLTLGLTGGRLQPDLDREEDEMIAAIKKIVAAAHKAGIKVGLHTGAPSYAARAIGWGMDMVTLSSDARTLMTGIRRDLGDLDDCLGRSRRQPEASSSGVY